MRRITRVCRIAECALYPLKERVRVVTNGERARFAGLKVCGSVWSCPVCSAAIRERRAQEVESAATRWLEDGRGLAFLTLTVPHAFGDDLRTLLDAVIRSWRAVQQNGSWRRERGAVGVLGYVRAVEITHGWNGWHPHLHLLLFLDKPVTSTAGMHRAIYTAWRSATRAAGLGEPSFDHGVRVQPVSLREGDAGVGAYLAKLQDGYAGAGRDLGREMTRGDLKRGRRRGHFTPFEIAERAANGEAHYLSLWWDYEQTTRGRRCIEWSRGLRDELQLGDEKTDDELAHGDDLEEQTVCVIGADDWRLVVTNNAQCDVLEAAEDHGRVGVERVIAALRRRE